jgi:cytochrome P450
VTVEWSTRDHQEVIDEGLAIREDFVDEFWTASVERRRRLIDEHRAGKLAADRLPRDLVTMVYLHQEEDWDEELPLREATLYLVAATQTTTHAVPHVLVHLTDWFEQHPEDRDKATSKEFLRMAAQESLRLHLPAPSLLRFAIADVTLSSGRTIARGERVACLVTPANRDPAVFGPDADRFDPYRKVAGRAKPWGLAFGGGDHLCIGRPLVTGLAGRPDGEAGTDGTLVNILLRLYEAGVQLDPRSPPQYTTASHHDAYSSMPILLTRR